MRCPHCGTRDTRVIDSRDLDESAVIRRRRECPACSTRFTTYERVEAARLIVVKRDGVRQEFDREKLSDGLRKALTMDKLRAIDHIAYIRFASVYQSFEDLEDLKREVDSLMAEHGTTTRKKGKRTT
jgi:transcriptional repressor NrdR